MPASSMALVTTPQMFWRWWREASSGTTPPQGACSAIWLETTLERIRVPSSTTAAAVSSQEVSMASRRTVSGPHQAGQALGVGRAGHAPLAHDGGDVAVGRDVEGRVADGDALGGQAPPSVVRDLLGRALLDLDRVPRGRAEVDGGDRRGHVEGQAVLPGQHGQGV